MQTWDMVLKCETFTVQLWWTSIEFVEWQHVIVWGVMNLRFSHLWGRTIFGSKRFIKVISICHKWLHQDRSNSTCLLSYKRLFILWSFLLVSVKMWQHVTLRGSDVFCVRMSKAIVELVWNHSWKYVLNSCFWITSMSLGHIRWYVIEHSVSCHETVLWSILPVS